MIKSNPQNRSNMGEFVKRFDDMVNGFSQWKLRSRTSYRHASIFRDTAHVFGHWKRKIVYVVQKTPAIPRRDDLNVYSL